MVIHDANTKRIGGRNRRVAAQTLLELKALDVGRWKGERFAGQHVPTLEEVMTTIPAGKRILVEIKCGTEIAAPMVRLVERVCAAGKGVFHLLFSQSCRAA